MCPAVNGDRQRNEQLSIDSLRVSQTTVTTTKAMKSRQDFRFVRLIPPFIN
jgi:hypothetical protein